MVTWVSFVYVQYLDTYTVYIYMHIYILYVFAKYIFIYTVFLSYIHTPSMVVLYIALEWGQKTVPLDSHWGSKVGLALQVLLLELPLIMKAQRHSSRGCRKKYFLLDAFNSKSIWLIYLEDFRRKPGNSWFPILCLTISLSLLWIL